MLQREHNLHHAGKSRSGFAMSEIRFHRTHQQRGVALRTVRRGGGEYLNGIAQRCARSMRLEVVDRRGRHLAKCATNHCLLGTPVGNSKAAASAVVIHGRAANDR